MLRTDLNLMQRRVNRMLTLTAHAFNTYELIGKQASARPSEEHQELQEALKDLLGFIQVSMVSLEHKLILISQDKKSNDLIMKSIPEQWESCKKEIEEKIIELKENYQAVINNLPSHDVNTIERIFKKIDKCFQSTEELSLKELRRELSHIYLQISLENLREKLSSRSIRCSCFISYAWGNLSNASRVYQLARDLKLVGIDVKLDIWDNTANSISVYVDQINKTDYVAVIGTLDLVEKWENHTSEGESRDQINQHYRGNAIVQELKQINHRLMAKPAKKHGVLCLLLEGDHEKSFPGFLKDLATHNLDFRDRVNRHVPLFHLLSEIINKEDRKQLEEVKQELIRKYEILEHADEKKLRAMYERCQEDVLSISIDSMEEDLDEFLKKRNTSKERKGKEKEYTSSQESPTQLSHLTLKLESLAKYFADTENLQEDASLYIAARGSLTPYSASTFDLEQGIEEALLADTPRQKVALILGESGSGKSMFGQSLVQKLAQAYLSEKEKPAYLPLFISLPMLAMKHRHSLMQETLKHFGFNAKEIEYLKKNQKFFVVLDAYDEIHITENLYRENKLDEWQLKLMMSCRTSYLTDKPDYEIFFMPFSGEQPQRGLLKEVHVAPFTQKEIDSYIEKYLVVKQAELENDVRNNTLDEKWLRRENYHEGIKQIPSLEELITTPFLLRITMEVLPTIIQEYTSISDVSKRLQMTQAKLYDAFVARWFKRQQERLIGLGIHPGGSMQKPLLEFTTALAKKMHEQGLTQVLYEGPGGEEGEGEWDYFFSDEPHSKDMGKFSHKVDPKKQKMRIACRKASLLKKEGENLYGFVHASLIEYFVSRKIFNDITHQAFLEKQKLQRQAAASHSLIHPSNISSHSFSDQSQGEKEEKENNSLPLEKVEAKKYGISYATNAAILKDKILAGMGEENSDTKRLGDIYISRGEISEAIFSNDSYYTADYINLLLYPFNQQECNIQVYAAITLDKVMAYLRQLYLQEKDYAFIPVNVAYSEEAPQHKNHWAALIIDKRHQLIFYLDPAQKTAIPSQVENMQVALGYQATIIANSIDFQQKEKQEGWIRHCGAYVVEIFHAFGINIQNGKCISGGQLPNTNIDPDSISLQAALSVIPCGEAEAVFKIRYQHLLVAHHMLEIGLKASAEVLVSLPPIGSSEGYFEPQLLNEFEAKQFFAKKIKVEKEVSLNNLEQVMPRDREEKESSNELDSVMIRADELEQQSLLGHGSYGVVYRGKYKYADVAIKEIFSFDDKNLEAFKKEAQVMARLRHPHTVILYGVYIEENRHLLVMEYMEKGALEDVLAEEPLSWQVKYQISQDVGAGLAYLHDKGIVHCDLKSANVFLDINYRAKVGDYGMSMIRRKNTAGKDSFGDWKGGSYAYMSPELLMGLSEEGEAKAKNTKEADVYAYGMVLWEISAATTPFADMAIIPLAKWVVAGGREKIPADTPSSFSKLINCCWEQEPSKRPGIGEAVRYLEEQKAEALLEAKEYTEKAGGEKPREQFLLQQAAHSTLFSVIESTKDASLTMPASISQPPALESTRVQLSSQIVNPQPQGQVTAREVKKKPGALSFWENKVAKEPKNKLFKPSIYKGNN